uniref:Peptidylprolyl isomerase H n=1 Tax=Amazona collaria TaxID=241587 RepID=A0A8B9FF82_9PSIT
MSGRGRKYSKNKQTFYSSCPYCTETTSLFTVVTEKKVKYISTASAHFFHTTTSAFLITPAHASVSLSFSMPSPGGSIPSNLQPPSHSGRLELNPYCHCGFLPTYGWQMMFCAVRNELLFLFRNETWNMFTTGVCNWQDSFWFGLSLTLFFCSGILKGDGTGVASIYRGPFADENFKLKHSAPGLLSMANSGPSTNGCQFFITCSKCDWLDGKHVVFGKIVDGLLVMRKIENVPTGPNNKPKLPVVISQCGEM